MSQLQVIALSCERGGRPLFAPQSFSLDEGQAMHIEGENGVGKTSLLRMVCGLAPAASGEVRWGGEVTTDHRAAFLRDVLYLGHSLGLKEELSALENLHAASVLAGQPVSRAQTLEALKTQGLASRAHLPLRVLSQGQKRRVALARLQLSSARLWVLDEPLVALDSAAIQALQQVLQTHVAQGGLLIFTSHQSVNVGMAVQPWRLGA